MTDDANDTPHGRLLGLTDGELMAMAPEATHQHAKGGLYRDMGPAIDADTHDVLVDADGDRRHAWLHVHPHARQVIVRKEREGDRFRELVRHDAGRRVGH